MLIMTVVVAGLKGSGHWCKTINLVCLVLWQRRCHNKCKHTFTKTGMLLFKATSIQIYLDSFEMTQFHCHVTDVFFRTESVLQYIASEQHQINTHLSVSVNNSYSILVSSQYGQMSGIATVLKRVSLQHRCACHPSWPLYSHSTWS